MAKNNFYETLGLERGATAKDIKTAYYAVSVW
jgi:DnaJ-class molecular chaperone